MRARINDVLAVALATALMSPVALAQSATGAVKGVGQAAAQVPQSVPQATLPTQASPRATDAQNKVLPTQSADRATETIGQTKSKTQERVDKTTSTKSPKAKVTTDTSATATISTDTQGLPPMSQGAEHAASHSAVVTRDLWMQLDTDADGRISLAEGDVNTDVKTSFAVMDADSDGFITETEYRTYAKTTNDQGAVGASNAAAGSAAATRGSLSKLDANADGKISLTEGEADASIKANFGMIDSNGDGFITDAEFRAYAKANKKP